MQRGWTVAVVLALGGAGCVETMEEVRPPQALIEAVQVSKLEPAGVCRAAGAVDARSNDDAPTPYESAYDRLRTTAAARGANYVVIDSVTGLHDHPSLPPLMAIHGRLYHCLASSTPSSATPVSWESQSCSAVAVSCGTSSCGGDSSSACR